MMENNNEFEKLFDNLTKGNQRYVLGILEALKFAQDTLSEQQKAGKCKEDDEQPMSEEKAN